MVDTALDFSSENPQSPLRLICFTNIDAFTSSLFAETLQDVTGKSG